MTDEYLFHTFIKPSPLPITDYSFTGHPSLLIFPGGCLSKTTPQHLKSPITAHPSVNREISKCNTILPVSKSTPLNPPKITPIENLNIAINKIDLFRL